MTIYTQPPHAAAELTPVGRSTTRARNQWRRRWPRVLLMTALVVLVSLATTQGAVAYLAHAQPLRLRPAELQKLALLRQTTEPRLMSEVSPDDRTIVTLALPETGRSGSEPGMPQFAFLNVEDGSSRPIATAVLDLEPQTDIVWRDPRTAVYVSADRAGAPLLVTLNRDTGAVASSPLHLPGRPVSLAPNGTRLLVEIAGGTGATLATFDLAAGSVTSLLHYPANGGPSSIAWTPDGSKLAFVRLALPGGTPTDPQQGMELAVQDALGALPPADNPFFRGSVVDVFDLAQHDFRPAALRAADHGSDIFNRVGWSADGRTLLVQMAQPARLTTRKYPIYRFPERAYLRFYDANLQLTDTLDRPETGAVLSSSARFISPDEVLIVAPAGMTYQLHYYNRTTGEFRTLPTAEGSFAEAPGGYQVYATHQSRQLVFNHSSFQHPPELYRIGWDGQPLRQLTHVNNRAAATNRIRVDQVTVPLQSGSSRTGYLLQPAGAVFPPRNAPIVLFQQGGPGPAMANRWGATSEDPFNLLPNFGIGLLVMTFPGREGWGPEVFTALKADRNFGQLDIDEAAEVIEYLIHQGYTARDRVGITGCSYGGYFTTQSIVRHPDLYAAANAQCSLLDLAHVWEYLPGRPDVTFWEGRTPASDPAEYAADSPITQGAKVRTPLLLFHGSADYLPASIAANFRDQIAAVGTPVELITFQDEGHGLSQPSNKMAAAQAQIRWFQRYLATGK